MSRFPGYRLGSAAWRARIKQCPTPHAPPDGVVIDGGKHSVVLPHTPKQMPVLGATATVLEQSGITTPEYGQNQNPSVEALRPAIVRLVFDNTGDALGQTGYDELAKAARSLEVAVPWTATARMARHGRRAKMGELNAPQNLTIIRFAALGSKSVLQVYRDIRTRKLLAISLGSLGTRLPAWQLARSARALTQAVMNSMGNDIDAWTVYLALIAPQEQAGGRAAVDVVTPSTVARWTAVVLGQLGIQGPSVPGARL